LLFRADENRHSEVIAIIDSGRMAIKNRVSSERMIARNPEWAITIGSECSREALDTKTRQIDPV